MNVQAILSAPSYNDLNKFEWLVLMTSITDHCRMDPARYEQLRGMVQTWQNNPPANMPVYDFQNTVEQEGQRF